MDESDSLHAPYRVYTAASLLRTELLLDPEQVVGPVVSLGGQQSPADLQLAGPGLTAPHVQLRLPNTTPPGYWSADTQRVGVTDSTASHTQLQTSGLRPAVSNIPDNMDTKEKVMQYNRHMT